MDKDGKRITFFTAWAEGIISEQFSVKLGRQVIAYDDQRIFGGVDWAQQGRSHDALVAHWKISGKSKLDIGLALNSDGEISTETLYSNIAGYKAFQYAWFHHDFDNVGLSILALNNGVEFEDVNMNNEINYSQTVGSHITFKKNRFISDFSVYFQTGKIRTNNVSASNFSGNVKYKITDEFLVGVGTEYLSGKDMNDTSTKIKSFNPLFGTNHKFNGWMDYFYVGNHGGSVGLVDINGVLAYSKNKFSVKALPHFFSSAADVYDGSIKMSNNLGFEIDLTAGYKFTKAIKFDAGFSSMFATESMEIVKGGGHSNENNYWGWAQITFKPTLFKTKSKTPQS
ncbi:MAG: alginate export family protein, partial [Urechidicola sp.]|nr:alginate export family protein [Urechidicola sp.]